jgi:hypothetical protein
MKGRSDVATVSEALGIRIRSERRRAGLTVRGLAGRTGLLPVGATPREVA